MADSYSRIARLEQRLGRIQATLYRIQQRMVMLRETEPLSAKFLRLNARLEELTVAEPDVVEELTALRLAAAEGRPPEPEKPGDVRIMVPAAQLSITSKPPG